MRQDLRIPKSNFKIIDRNEAEIKRIMLDEIHRVRRYERQKRKEKEAKQSTKVKHHRR